MLSGLAGGVSFCLAGEVVAVNPLAGFEVSPASGSVTSGGDTELGATILAVEVGTTDAPPGKKDAPSGSTDAPPGTTDTPSGSTDAPPGTTDAPPGKKDAPLGTTDAPPRRIDAPLGTEEVGFTGVDTESGASVSVEVVEAVVDVCTTLGAVAVLTTVAGGGALTRSDSTEVAGAAAGVAELGTTDGVCCSSLVEAPETIKRFDNKICQYFKYAHLKHSGYRCGLG